MWTNKTPFSLSFLCWDYQNLGPPPLPLIDTPWSGAKGAPECSVKLSFSSHQVCATAMDQEFQRQSSFIFLRESWWPGFQPAEFQSYQKSKPGMGAGGLLVGWGFGEVARGPVIDAQEGVHGPIIPETKQQTTTKLPHPLHYWVVGELWTYPTWPDSNWLRGRHVVASSRWRYVLETVKVGNYLLLSPHLSMC